MCCLAVLSLCERHRVTHTPRGYGRRPSGHFPCTTGSAVGQFTPASLQTRERPTVPGHQGGHSVTGWRGVFSPVIMSGDSQVHAVHHGLKSCYATCDCRLWRGNACGRMMSDAVGAWRRGAQGIHVAPLPCGMPGDSQQAAYRDAAAQGGRQEVPGPVGPLEVAVLDQLSSCRVTFKRVLGQRLFLNQSSSVSSLFLWTLKNEIA